MLVQDGKTQLITRLEETVTPQMYWELLKQTQDFPTEMQKI